VPDPLKVLVEPTRQRILQLVLDRELSAGDIAAEFDVTFGAISQHLRLLRDAGLVTVRKEGRHRWYRARSQDLGPLAGMLRASWATRLGKLKKLAEREARKSRRN
jgi:DNA-binding transcriptional ArsR family regulator